MAQTDETTNKLIGILIKVLHSEYSDTRDLAVAQLALLGEKAKQPLTAFLKNMEELEQDLQMLEKIYPRGNSDRDSHVELFRKNWGQEPDEYSDNLSKIRVARMWAIKGALRTLSILGMEDRQLTDLFPLATGLVPFYNLDDKAFKELIYKELIF